MRKIGQALRQRDQAVLRFIKEFIARHGYPPVLSEIATQFDLHKTTVFESISRLQDAGELSRDKPGGSRALKVQGVTYDPHSLRTQHLPVLRSSAALQRYLDTPGHREVVPLARLLSTQAVQIIPIAQLQPASKRPSFRFEREESKFE